LFFTVVIGYISNLDNVVNQIALIEDAACKVQDFHYCLRRKEKRHYGTDVLFYCNRVDKQFYCMLRQGKSQGLRRTLGLFELVFDQVIKEIRPE
jgi:hypothetical protein